MIFLKKALSLIFSLILLCCLVFTTYAAGSKTVTFGGYKETTTNGGLFGKASNEYAFLASGAAKYSLTMKSPDGDFADKKYFVVDINFAPDGSADANTIVRMSGADDIGNEICMAKLAEGDYKANRWNHARLIIEDSNYETMMANGKSQKFTLYLNGVLIKEDVQINKHATLYETQFKGLRVMFGADDGVTTRKTYLADFVMSESDTKPVPVVPTLASTSLYTVDNTNDTIELSQALTVSDIVKNVSGASVKVYKNEAFALTLSDNDTLTYGNIIVLKSDDNIYKYYNIANGSFGETLLSSATALSQLDAAKLHVGNGSKSAVTGIGTKADSDESIYLRSSSAGADTYIQYAWGTSNTTTTKPASVYDYDWDKKCGVFTDYVVIEASIYPIDITTANLVTDYGTTITDNFIDSLVMGAWNRVRIVLDRTATTSTNNITKAMVYVNGKATTSAWKSTNSLGDHYGSYKAKNALRIRLLGGDVTGGGAYIDDIRIYEAKALRDNVTATLNTSDKYTLDGNFVVIPHGAKLSASDISVAEGMSVTTFNSSMTETVTEISDGCVIAVYGKSDTAKELNLPYDDIYSYYTVTKAKEKFDLVTTNPNFLSNNGTSEVVSGGVMGNNSGNVKKIIIKGSNNYFNRSWKSASFGMNYLVLAVNVLPTDGITNVFIGTNQHAVMSPTVTVDQYLVKDTWNSLLFVYDITANTTDTYVNGELISFDYTTKYVKGTSDSFRFIISGSEDSYAYVDNFYLYESAYAPVPSVPEKLESGDVEGLIINNKTFSARISSETTVSDITALFDDGVAKVYTDNACTKELSADDKITDAAVIALKSGTFNAYTVYNVSTYGTNEIIAIGDTYDKETSSMKEGSVSFFAYVTEGGSLIATQYDENGVLSKIAIDSADSEASLSLNFTPDKLDNSTVKVFLMKSASSLAPLCEPLEIDYINSIDILFLGNSYSMDVSWYLGSIAEADDVSMNVYVLNKGGCSLSYHYDNRLGSASELGINFWKNDVSLGTLYNLDTALDKFDFDYVVIQNSSTSEGIDNTSESNYQDKWAVAVPFAQYIHENEPDARIAFHSTWSMESGYNFVGDVNERNQINDNMLANALRASKEINEALGFEGDDKVLVIDSTSMIYYARHYELPETATFNGREAKQGTKIFDTTYYKQGHIFDSKEIAVGDGTMLLNDADKAAGKISLHRDGFHMSALSRYLIALNAYKTLTGNDVTGNTFSPASIRLDCSPGGYHVTETDKGALTGTCYQTYDALTPEVIALCQTLVDERI